MGLNATPTAERIHIGFFGRTNAGKSSLVNAVTAQKTSLVSEVHGTTTDAVRKAMELLPLGPVMIIDTPGIDDKGVLGEERAQNTRKVIETVDIAVVVVDAVRGISAVEEGLFDIFLERKVPFVVAYSKADLLENRHPIEENGIYVSAATGEGVEAFKEKLASLIPAKTNKIEIVNSFVKKGDFVILVTPIDESAPKGRIILPQQNVLRNILDIGAVAIVTQVEELPKTLKGLATTPSAVITDSQAFREVAEIVPLDIPLTSFSILFAKYKGILDEAVTAVQQIEELSDGDRILIAEGCSHHRQCNDIGTVKIPSWIKKHTGKEICFEFTSGKDFPEDLTPYKLILHCGGCMITEREVMARMGKAKNANIPFTNYGTLIAYMNGILKRSIQVFPELYNKVK